MPFDRQDRPFSFTFRFLFDDVMSAWERQEDEQPARAPTRDSPKRRRRGAKVCLAAFERPLG